MRKVFLLLLSLSFLHVDCFAQSTELTHIRTSLPHINDSLHYVDALNRMAVLMYSKNIDSTFYYTQKAREIAERLNYEKGKIDALANLGVVFDAKGNLQMSLHYYNEAHAGYSRLHDTTNVVRTLMYMAITSVQMRKSQRAVQQFNAALHTGQNLAKDSILSWVIYNYLLGLPNRFSRDSTQFYIGKARRIASRYHDKLCLFAINELLTVDMINHGQREKGLVLLRQTINHADSEKMAFASTSSRTFLGNLLTTSAPGQAATVYEKALIIADQNGDLVYKQIITKKLFELYTVQHDSIKAAAYSRQLVRLRDELDQLNNTSNAIYLDYALKEQQVKSLLTQSKYQTVLLMLVILVCLLAIAVIVVTRRNLKGTKRLNEQIIGENVRMKKALDALEESQADNTRMMRIVSHDLRDPIAGMYSIADLMLNESGRSENDRDMLELIKASGQNSLDLVSQLLQVQFMEEELKKQPVDIDEMLQYCVSLLSDKAAAKGQQINLQSQPLILNASREKLWRVISNLIGNAIKFSATNSIIDVRMEPHSRDVQITVKDHGIGIPPEIGDKIFDMFTRAKRPGTAGEQPFGLGLAISKQIVAAHGGEIWFESKADNGTTFFVALPIVN